MTAPVQLDNLRKDIKHALSSPSLCSEDTIGTLRQLLGAEIEAAHECVGVAHQKTVSSSRTGQTPKTARNTKRAQLPKAKSHANEKAENTRIALDSKDRYGFATEVVNIVLQTLSVSSKNLPSKNDPIRPHNNAASHVEPSRSIGASSRNSSLESPGGQLESRSANCVPATKQKHLATTKSSIKISSTTSATDTFGVTAIAECGKLAFECLRGQPAATLAGTWHLENGMIAFAGRLVALGLTELAAKELKALKRCLENRGDPSRRGSDRAAVKSPQKMSATSHRQETLASLIHFDYVPKQEPSLLYTINHQILVLKLAVATRRPAVIQALSKYLDTSSPSSPVNLLLKYAMLPGLVERAANQLELVAQLVLSLCQYGDSQSEPGNRGSINPDTFFRLQTLALQAHILWRRLARHRGNIEVEVLRPFLKCMTSYISKFSTMTAETYQLLFTSYTILEAEVIEYRRHVLNLESTQDTVRMDILLQLSRAAESAGLWNEAERCAQDLLDSKETLQYPEIKKSIIALRLITAQLYRNHSTEKRPHIHQILQPSTKSLSLDLAASVSDVALLLIQSTELLNAMVSFNKRSFEKPNEDSQDDQHSFDCSCWSVFDWTLRLILKCLKLCESQQDSSANHRMVDLRQKTLRVVRPSVESILVWCRTQVVESRSSWEPLDGILQSCLGLVRRVQINESSNAIGGGYDLSESQNSIYHKLSHFYWTIYSTAKAKDESSDTSLKALKRACECLDGRQLSEMKAALLPLKLAKLACLYEKRKQYQEAREALTSSIKLSVQCGSCYDVQDGIDTPHFRAVWPRSTDFASLCQMLERFLHLGAIDHQEKQSKSRFYDDEELSPLLRTLVLEWQLYFLAKDQTSSNLARLRREALPAIYKILNAIYRDDPSPGRRWRAALPVLHLVHEDSNLVENQYVLEVVELLSKECVLPTDEKTKHYNNLEHVRALLLVALAFRNSTESQAKLREALAIWMKLVNSNSSQSSRILEYVGEIDDWLLQLQRVSAYVESQCLSNLQMLVLRLLSMVYALQGPENIGNRVLNQLKLGIQYLRMGCTEEAGIHLMRVRDLFKNLADPSDVFIAYHAAHLEYYHAIGNMEKSKEHFAQVVQASAPAIEPRSGGQLHSKVTELTLTSQRLYAEAQFVCFTSPYAEALHFAKSNVEMLQRTWKTIETRSQSQVVINSRHSDSVNQDIVGLSKSMSDLAIGPDTIKSALHSVERSYNGPAFWQLAPVMHRSLLQVSSIYYHYGMFQETIHQLQQAQQLAEGFPTNTFLASILAQAGDYRCRGGLLQDGSQYLQRAGQTFGDLDHNIELARYYCLLGYSNRLSNQWQGELESYNHAEGVLDAMSSPLCVDEIVSLPSSSPTRPDPLQLSIISAASVVKQNSRKKTQVKSKSSREVLAVSTQRTEVLSSSKHQLPCLKFENLRTEISRRKAESILAQGDTRTSLEFVKSATTLPTTVEARAQQRATMAKILIGAALSELSQDAIFSLLPESTITFPAVAISSTRRGSSNMRKSSTTTLATSSPVKKSQKGTTMKRAARVSLGKLEKAADLFCQAMNTLSDLRSSAVYCYSNMLSIQLCGAFTNAAMLLPFVQPEVVGTTIYPALVAYSIDLPQSIVSIRERAVAAVNSAKYQNSSPFPAEDGANHESQYVALSAFQSDMIDLIPDTWTAVSVSLDESKEHVYLVRYQAQQSPFILRLPLTRQNTEDPGEETFTFSEAKEELDSIIKSSDATVHAAQNNPDQMNTKGAKTSWWAEREALDERLKNLLLNMENIWLGGFRGILSQSQHDPHLLARFQQSFEIILEKHLPSRQHIRGRNEKSKVQLSPKVFELFVGLSSQSEEVVDLDEALTDLLYYIVDILQFNGECNAYDEIDFDAMIVETQDALHSYHEAAMAEDPTPIPRHTILILDKQLHAFPWESMPCLELQSVSRVSSLHDLRERILFMKHQQSQGPTSPATNNSGILASPKNGTYILNPSTDLSKTQSRFQPALSSLAETNFWHSIIARIPTEDEFATALTPPIGTTTSTSTSADTDNNNNHILLYFGHGSGAQYIRPRRIKRLPTQQNPIFLPNTTASLNPSFLPPPTPTRPTCATTLLFGCSSAALATPGEFNIYGPPITYLVAGAPAVLGSLWDVTDGDCDVFAAETLEGWGVLGTGSCSAVDKGGKGKAKAKAKTKVGGKAAGGMVGEKGKGKEDRGERWGALCLSEAAARARRKCYLRYLNGATMVVYGVPVFVAR